MPNTRSEGARRTGAAIAAVTIAATARTTPTSAMRPRTVDHRGGYEQRAGDGPAPHVANMRRESGGARQTQRKQTRRLSDDKKGESSQEAPPTEPAERGDPQREIETDL